MADQAIVDDLNRRRRAWFHRHFPAAVASDAAIGIVNPRWEHDGTEVPVPFRLDLDAQAP